MSYEYRKLTPADRKALVQERVGRGFPPHAPPHPIRDQAYYLLTAACYEHANHLEAAERRQDVLNLLRDELIRVDIGIRGWVILPNHYHLLIRPPNFSMIGGVIRLSGWPELQFTPRPQLSEPKSTPTVADRLVHGPLARQWNIEDGTPGRKIWYRFADRAIRSEAHYFTALNYLHYNPVKHGWASSPYEWQESSVHWYRASFGREWLRDSWVRYPVRDFGRRWDDFAEATTAR